MEKHGVFLTKICVLGVCIYIWIYISTLMMISLGTFFLKCCLPVIVERGIIHLMVRSLNKNCTVVWLFGFSGS